MAATVTEAFRNALEMLDDGATVCPTKGSTLVDMFDDINSQWLQSIQRLHDTEQQFYYLAVKFQQLQKLHTEETKHASSTREELQFFKREKRQYEKKMANIKQLIMRFETEIQEKDEEIDNLQEAIDLCRDVILEKDDFNLPPDTKQTLIRVCSRTQSMKFAKKRNLNRVEETLESLDDNASISESFDNTGDLLDVKSDKNALKIYDYQEQSINVLEMSMSRCAPTTAKRRSSRELRRYSAEKEQEDKSSVDSFWAVRAPVKFKLGSTNAPSIAKHSFSQKKTMNLIPKSCSHCHKKFAIQSTSIKCTTTGCNTNLHEHCRDLYRAPCITANFKSSRQPLSKFILNPAVSPRIPYFLYMAIHEVETRLHEEGIYRINGPSTEIQELKKKYISNNINQNTLRSIVDTNTICSTIKDFFRNVLDEPILTYAEMPKFIKAADNNNVVLAKQLFIELPPENRDTLAFLLFHFKNVIQRCHANKMTKENMAKSVGPSIIGFVTESPDASEIMEAAKYQEGVLSMLLEIPQQFFNKFLDLAETTQGTLSSLATSSNIESLDAFGEANNTCVENRRVLFRPISASKPSGTEINPSAPFQDKKVLFKRY